MIFFSTVGKHISNVHGSFIFAKFKKGIKLSLRKNCGIDRRVARNFDRGGKQQPNNQVSIFDYLMTLIVKASSTKGAFF